MLFNVGDYVTRESYNNDTVFKIIEIKDSIAILQGVNIRLIADSNISDLVLCEKCKEDLETDDSKLLERMDSFNKLNRDINDFENVDKYIKENCAYGCKYFILEKIN